MSLWVLFADLFYSTAFKVESAKVMSSTITVAKPMRFIVGSIIQIALFVSGFSYTNCVSIRSLIESVISLWGNFTYQEITRRDFAWIATLVVILKAVKIGLFSFKLDSVINSLTEAVL